MTEMLNLWDAEIDKIMNAGNIYIFTHANPDGDAVASSSALCLALTKCGKNAKVILGEKTPPMYDHLLIDDINYVIDAFNYEVNEKTVAISVDASNLERLGEKLSSVFSKMPHRITIDHHLGEKDGSFTDADFTNSKWSATCEGLYCLIERLLSKNSLEMDYEIAVRLYTGILTDTGKFVYSCTTGDTMRIVGNLLDITGSDLTWISKIHYDYKTESCQKLVARSVARMESFLDGQIVFSYVNDEDFLDTKAEIADSSSISSALINTIDAKIAIFMRPTEILIDADDSTERSWKLSLRSIPEENVSVICGKFGGGGHKNASGATVFGTFEKVKKMIVDEAMASKVIRF